MNYIEKIDDFLIDTYQRLIGDPLQERGINLLAQWRVWFSIVVAQMLWYMIQSSIAKDFINLACDGVFFVWWLQRVLWPGSMAAGDLSRPIRLTSARATRNPFRGIPALRVIRLLIVFMSFAVSMSRVMEYITSGKIGFLIGFAGDFSFALAELTDASDPKPRKPKRVKIRIGEAVPVGARS